jgi:hypothetical protein
MSLMPTTPRSIGGVLDDAIRLYRRSWLPCLPIVLILLVVTLPLSLLIAARMQSVVGNPQAMLALFKSPVIWQSYFVLIVVMCAVYGALFAQANAIAHGERLSVMTALGVGLKRSPVSLGVGLLFALIVGVGTMLLVIPGIYLWGVFQLAFAPAVIERAGVFESLTTSRRLTKGNWWRTFTIITVALIIMYVLIISVTFLVGIIAGVSTMAAMVGAQEMSGALVTQQIISSVLNMFVMSFLPCIVLAVYYDLKLRKEGADLAGRIDALKPSS